MNGADEESKICKYGLNSFAEFIRRDTNIIMKRGDNNTNKPKWIAVLI